MKPYYQDDAVTIYHGDCREILRSLGSVDVAITDPPYNAGKNYGDLTNDRRDWPDWCAWWDQCLELIAASAPDILSFMSQTSWKQYVRLGRHEIDWTLVWNKPLALSVCAMAFMPHWEPIAYWGLTRKKDGAFWGGDVLSHNVEKPRYGHPAIKPLGLMRDLVSRFDGLILDPFMGSGTTLRAAKDLRRKAIGIEIEEKYCEIAANRMSQSVMSIEV